MAYLSSTSAKIMPENYSARVKSITVRVCITNCTGFFISRTSSCRQGRWPRDG